MPDQTEQIEIYKYELSELESHLVNLNNQLNSIQSDIKECNSQIGYIKDLIQELS